MQAYLTPGRELASYRVESLIGRGGMAMVYLAEHLRLSRKVALKLLAPDLAEDEHFQQRFIRESRLAAAIDHPNIIPIYDAGEAEGLLYIAMRFVAGTDLRALLKRVDRLDPARTLAILAQVAGALDAAHAQGLVHRDVKPANILLGPGPGAGPDDPDHVYLTDFGITKWSSSASGLTATGQFVGTLDYAAPEQIEGKPVDGRADVYALGCVAYQCLAGVPPYKHDDDRAVLWAHLVGEIPSITVHRPDLPASFDEVVARALAKVPDDRYQTCRAFTDALAAILAEDADAHAEAQPGPAGQPPWLPSELQEAMAHPLASVRAASVMDLSRLLRGRHPVVALAAREALEALLDDSRRVAALAAAALEEAEGPVDTAATLGAPERPADAEPADDTADDNAAVAGIGGGRQLGTPGSMARDTRRAQRARAGDQAAARRRGDRLLAVAGGLAVVGAALLIVSLFPAYRANFRLGSLPGTMWYVLLVAAVTLSAGACMLAPYPGRLIGPGRVFGAGLLLGAVAAPNQALLETAVAGWRISLDTNIDAGLWLSSVASVILILAACLAGLAMVGAAEVRVVPRPPAGVAPWLLVLLGVAGAVAFFQYQRALSDGFKTVSGGVTYGLFGVALIWVVAMALVVPVCAALATPRRFGAALLAGWIGGGAAIFALFFGVIPGDRALLVVFGATLLALLLVTIPFAITAPTVPVEHVAYSGDGA